MPNRIRVIGGGLAGPEAALQAARLGCEVALYEMRPVRSTEAHQTADFAELVCSNSLKSESENTAPWLLKQEMRRAGSILLTEADASAVPAGHALAVDRVEFSRRVAARIEAEPRITVHREEVTRPRRARSRHHHHPRHRPAHLARAHRRTHPPHRLRPPRLLRLHLAHRRRLHHRHGQASTSQRATTRAPPTTSTAPSPKRSTTASSTPSLTAEAVEPKSWEAFPGPTRT